MLLIAALVAVTYHAAPPLHLSSSGSTSFVAYRVSPTLPRACVARAPEPGISEVRRARLITGFAFFSGWMDVACFLRFDSYANMMTGNLIRLATAIAELKRAETLFFATVLLHYMSGISLFRLAQVRLAWRGPSAACSLLAPLVAILYVAVDVCDRLGVTSRLPMLSLALASGVINAAAAETTGSVICMVTGHCQKVATGFVDWWAGRLAAGDPRRGVLRSGGIMLAFASGVACSTAAMMWCGSRLPRFSGLGAVFGLLLMLCDTPMSSWRALPPRTTPTPADACIIDEQDTVCK